MGRVHLFELLDFPGWPAVLRRGCTSYLQWITCKLNLFDMAPALILRALKVCKTNTILDLGSGSGGPWFGLSKKIHSKIPDCEIILSDKFPDSEGINRVKAIGHPKFSYCEQSVDALQVAQSGSVLRTQFFSFHHFKPEDACSFLSDSVRNNHGILIFDGSRKERTKGILTSPMIFFMSLFSSPFWKPFTPVNILFSIFPLIPLSIMFDGIVSYLRFYSKEELLDLVAQADPSGQFDWEAEDVQTKYGWITYLAGFPRS